MKKIISVLTATRAEYGLLKPVINKLNKIEDFDVRLVVTGAHLSPEFGLTYKEIEEDEICIDEKIEILLSSDTPSSISKSMGLAMISFADYFSKLKPDLLIVLGDRYETLAVAMTAMNQRIPIAHIHGGETTEGAIDEVVRHAITKLSYLHFASTEDYRNRIIQLGENPLRTFNVGALGIENIKNNEYLSKNDLLKSVGVSLSKPYAVVTFHPVTLEKQCSKKQISELLKAISLFEDISFIFTSANSDSEGRIINSMIYEFVKNRDNCVLVESLGVKKYLTALKYSSLVIGNSSSGIIEAPTFKIPTINIGDRQKGRIQSRSIINCEPEYEAIIKAIHRANSLDFREVVKHSANPYERENTSLNIAKIIKHFFSENKIDLKKKFYNMEISSRNNK